MDTHQKLDNTVDHVTTTHMAKDVDMIVCAQFLKCRYILSIVLMCALFIPVDLPREPIYDTDAQLIFSWTVFVISYTL